MKGVVFTKILIGFCVFCQIFLNAQQTKYYLAIGTNMVDDSFAYNYNPFEFEEQWHFGKTILAFKFGVDIDYRWIMEAGFSANTYNIGKRVNGQIITSPK